MLDEIAVYLQSKNLGTIGVDLMKGLMPEEPDGCTAIFEYAGDSPDLHWNGEYPGLQVRVRAETYDAARAQIGKVAKELHGLHEQVLSAVEGEAGTRYLLIKAAGSPELLKYLDRVEFVQHFSVIKERRD